MKTPWKILCTTWLPAETITQNSTSLRNKDSRRYELTNKLCYILESKTSFKEMVFYASLIRPSWLSGQLITQRLLSENICATKENILGVSFLQNNFPGNRVIFANNLLAFPECYDFKGDFELSGDPVHNVYIRLFVTPWDGYGTIIGNLVLCIHKLFIYQQLFLS